MACWRTTFRRAYLAETARLAGRRFEVASDICFATARQAQSDKLADAVEEHLDTGAAVAARLPGLPGLPPGAP